MSSFFDKYNIPAIFDKLGLKEVNSGAFNGQWLTDLSGPMLDVISPINGQLLARVQQAGPADYEKVVAKAEAAFKTWRIMPAPQRGEIVRQIGEELRKYKKELGALVTLEMGKIRVEGEGEVQEMIDICDFATGMSRQLYGLSMHSERPLHRMYEQWHPLGIVGIITAFNFPVAVWAWNAMLAAICGDTMILKPSEKTPLTAIACYNIADRVLKANNVPDGVMCMILGTVQDVGERLVADPRIPLISATGSIPMGRRVGQVVAGRLGRSLLELGGNNAIIVTENADLSMAIRAIAFGSVGTAGQRCTSTRRIIVHESIKDELVIRLIAAYKQVPIGNPLEAGTLMGPLIDNRAVESMMSALEKLKAEGGRVLYGGEKLSGDKYPGGNYVTPCIAEAKNDYAIVQHETFAPILYIIAYKTLDEAMAIQNGVPQGLSSSMFTLNMRESERFLSAAGSDCGIANINIGTSGAEIGGAFGGEKETGGGRESGSDAWKIYMRRQTNTINWSTEMPLAQGIKFDV